VISRSGLYALQAVMFLARQPRGAFSSAARMAEQLAVPPEYLAKVLHRLRRRGVLVSTRGAKGGYSLKSPATGMSVEDVVGLFDEVRPPEVCLNGGACDAESPCVAHTHRLRWNSVRKELLEHTAVTDLLDDCD